jgi:hypothetical protein
LLDLEASPQTMDFYMRHLADKLLTQIERVGHDVYSTQTPDLNGFVRRRLAALQAADHLSGSEPSGLSAGCS